MKDNPNKTDSDWDKLFKPGFYSINTRCPGRLLHSGGWREGGVAYFLENIPTHT